MSWKWLFPCTLCFLRVHAHTSAEDRCVAEGGCPGRQSPDRGQTSLGTGLLQTKRSIAAVTRGDSIADCKDKNEGIWKAMIFSYRVSQYGLNFLEPGLSLFDVDGCDFDVLAWNRVKSDTSTTDHSQEYANEMSQKFGLSGGASFWGWGFTAQVQLDLERHNSGRVQTVRSTKKMLAMKYRVSRSFADPSSRLKPGVERILKERSVYEIVSSFGEFYAKSITMGGQFESTHVMEKSKKDTKQSLSLEMETKWKYWIGHAAASSQTSLSSSETESHHKVTSSWKVSGGDAAIWLGLDDNNLAEIQRNWANSVSDDNLFPVKIGLAPIWDLVRPHDADKAERLEKYLTEKWAAEGTSIPEYMPAGISEEAARHMEGFKRISTMIVAAAWHASNHGKEYWDDSRKDSDLRDLQCLEMGYDWEDMARLGGLANSLKWMAQDFAWFALANRQHGTRPEDSTAHDAFLAHRERVRELLDPVGLFWPINHMVTDYTWWAINGRHGGGGEGSKAKGDAHHKRFEEQLVKLWNEKAWPLFEA